MKRMLIAALLVVVAAGLGAQNADLAAGASVLQAGDYKAAVAILRKVTADPAQSGSHADAYLLLAKAQIALASFADASASLEHYLQTFPKHRSYPEAVYLKGRLLYLQGEFESSIIALQRFLKSYPESVFAPNATYWAGEALFALGRLDESLALMHAVTRQWPDSAKAEAAGYRASLIELHKREVELLKLLKASHQEALTTIEEFQKRERTYEQAIAAYQRRLAGGGSETEKQAVAVEKQLAEREREVEALRAQVDALTRQLAQAAAQPVRTETAAASPPVVDHSARLLKAKEQALDLKSRLVSRLSGEGKR